VINSYLDTAGDANADILNTSQGLWCPSHPGEIVEGTEYFSVFNGAIPTRTSAATHGHLASYGYNHKFLGTQWTDAPNAKNWFYRKKSWVKFPSHIITHADNAYSFPPSDTGYHYWTKINRTDPIFNSRDPSDADTALSADMIPEFHDELRYPIGEWHFKGASVVCLDGHVEWQTQKKWHAAEFDHRWQEPHADFVKRIPD